MNLKEFWNSKELLAIKCDSIEEAKILLKAFDRMGKKWGINLEAYTSYTYWDVYRKSTCYLNNGLYTSLGNCINKDIKVIPFDEIEDIMDNSFVIDDKEERQEELNSYTVIELVEALQRKLKEDK